MRSADVRERLPIRGAPIEEATLSPKMTQWATNVDSEPAASTPAERKQNRRDYECDDPAAYVFNIHTPENIREKLEAPLAGPCLRKLQEHDIGRTYPGFDILTVHPGTGGIDRLIELKSSGLNIRKVGVTWNEWKTASHAKLRDRYFLYVVGGLRRDTNTRPFLREIRNPFEVLQQREHSERTQSQRQVDLNLRYFTAEEGEVRQTELQIGAPSEEAKDEKGSDTAVATAPP